MRLYKTRWKYWSCSKFANWVNDKFGIPKRPTYATLEEWKELKKEHKKYKFAYWFTEEFLSSLQNFVYFPYDVYYTIKCLIMNRFIDKNYMLESDLDKWTYRDYDTRLLHSVFDSYCNSFCIAEKGRGSKEKLYKHWDWETKLVYSKDDGFKEDDSKYGELTPQAISAMQQKILFEWWQERKNRSFDDEIFLSFEQENHLDEIDDEMLKKLIDIRRGLWT